MRSWDMVAYNELQWKFYGTLLKLGLIKSVQLSDEYLKVLMGESC